MTTYSWDKQRAEAIAAFNGELPKAETEADVIEAFEQQPLSVIEAISAVAEQVRQGKARSGWAVLRSRVQGAVSHGEDVVVSGKDERGLRIRQAEAWIKNAGLHLDRESELIDSLFGDFGLLRDYAKDEVLQRRMLEQWRKARPGGEHVEQEAERRGKEYREWFDAEPERREARRQKTLAEAESKRPIAGGTN